MSTITFQAQVDREQVIRPPVGITLPEGVLEVTVRPVRSPAAHDDLLAPTRAWLLELAAEAECDAPDLPADLAEQHDHYAHGKARP